jgi:hypothetical protein
MTTTYGPAVSNQCPLVVRLGREGGRVGSDSRDIRTGKDPEVEAVRRACSLWPSHVCRLNTTAPLLNVRIVGLLLAFFMEGVVKGKKRDREGPRRTYHAMYLLRIMSAAIGSTETMVDERSMTSFFDGDGVW